MSATGTERDDPVVMQPVIAIAVGGAMIGLRFMTGWTRMDRALSVVGVLLYVLPVAVSAYRIARPFVGKARAP